MTIVDDKESDPKAKKDPQVLSFTGTGRGQECVGRGVISRVENGYPLVSLSDPDCTRELDPSLLWLGRGLSPTGLCVELDPGW